MFVSEETTSSSTVLFLHYSAGHENVYTPSYRCKLTELMIRYLWYSLSTKREHDYLVLYLRIRTFRTPKSAAHIADVFERSLSQNYQISLGDLSITANIWIEKVTTTSTSVLRLFPIISFRPSANYFIFLKNLKAKEAMFPTDSIIVIEEGDCWIWNWSANQPTKYIILMSLIKTSKCISEFDNRTFNIKLHQGRLRFIRGCCWAENAVKK